MKGVIPSISSLHLTNQNNNFLVRKWNSIVFLIGVFSFNLDPIFVYIRKDCGSNSICMDVKLGAIVAILRTLADVSFLFCKLYMRRKFTIVEGSRTLGFSEESKLKDHNYQKSSFYIDIAAITPLPQIILWNKIRTSGTYMSPRPNSLISRVIFLQFPFRAVAMVPVSKNTINMMGMEMRNAWTGALINLMYFMIASNTWGALYYEMYVSKLLNCKRLVFIIKAGVANLDWDQLLAVCTQSHKFEVGMFSDAFASQIFKRSFAQKYVYCLSWGLKSLSSFGQIFTASSYAMDTILSFTSVVFGLVLFGDLLARMQSGLQSTEVREGRQRTRQRMVEEWMAYHQLPHGLKRQVKEAIQSEWSVTRGMDDEAILGSLPWHVRREVRIHLYLDIVRSLHPLKEMDDHLVKEICGHLRTFSSHEGTYITIEGEPVRQLIFIFCGQVEVSSGNNGGYSLTLGPGEMCGQELLVWCSFPTRSTENLPSSTQTVKCITDVDAFSLPADDVKLLAIQFHRDGKFRRAFQLYAA